MKALDLIKKLQELYAHYGNVEVIVSEVEDVMDICEPDDTKEIKDVEGLPCGEGAIVLKV